MRALIFLLLFAAYPQLAAAQRPERQAAPMASDPVMEARLQKLAEELRCLVCQNESLAGSRAELAVDLRNQIRAQMEAGASDRQIIDYLVQRYGDFILYRPPVKSTTAALWVGPFILLVGAGALLVIRLRRRKRELGAPGLAESDYARAEQLLSSQEPPR